MFAMEQSWSGFPPPAAYGSAGFATTGVRAGCRATGPLLGLGSVAIQAMVEAPALKCNPGQAAATGCFSLRANSLGLVDGTTTAKNHGTA